MSPYNLKIITLHERDFVMTELVPIIATVLIIVAAIDIYRNGEHKPSESNHKTDDNR